MKTNQKLTRPWILVSMVLLAGLNSRAADGVWTNNATGFNALIPKWINAVVPYPADFNGPNTCELKSTLSVMRVLCATSLPGLRTDIHARPNYVAPEQFILLSLASGESREWTRAYSFSLHDAGSGSRSFRRGSAPGPGWT